MKQKKYMLFLFICIFGMFLTADAKCVLASQEKTEDEDVPLVADYGEELEYDEIQKVINEIQNGSEEFNFEEYVNEFVSGEEPFDLSNICSKLANGVLNQIVIERKTIIQLLAIAVIASVFTNFTNVFQNSHIAETGFYVTYLLLFTLLTTSFYQVTRIAEGALTTLLDFMKALLPTYFICITFSAGAKTSMVFYESTLVLITIINVVLIKILLPLINVYFILLMANNIMKEDMLSKFAELLEMVISWSLKTILGAVVGFNVIQGLVVPVTDYVKQSMMMKTANAIPGVGNAFSSVTETVFAAGVLIKNSVGAAGLIAIVVICANPVIKLGIYSLIYKLGAAIVQPISDKRVLNCINGTAKSARLLVSMVIIAAVLFIFTIVIITTSTNLHLSS
ncbi:stage III sporulation protein AE [Anaeromicropila populeti]|uniref:Stage III sporulation protein AE n=1 Tax=Anaeromicropila populeti TaxID=37658 RepID=A0A1I6ILC8_9FIRM|nr:stage III sporulation protein AE [Anaeromicropila populeti]SFR67577.1 stage III sporulation protein AE [Anaeromicropila populeti]